MYLFYYFAVVRQIFSANVSLTDKTVKFHELGILSHINSKERNQTDIKTSESEDNVETLNNMDINKEKKLIVSYRRIKNEKDDLCLITDIHGDFLTHYPAYYKKLINYMFIMGKYSIGKFIK